MNTRSLLAPLVGLALVACARQGDMPLAPAVPSVRAGASEQVTVAGVPLTLQCDLSRDFMPFSPPEGRPLQMILQVRSMDGSPLPAGLGVMSASVFHQGETWLSTPEVMTNFTTPTLLQARSTGGPLWGPGVYVNVLLTLSAPGHQRVHLIGKNQLIAATY